MDKDRKAILTRKDRKKDADKVMKKKKKKKKKEKCENLFADISLFFFSFLRASTRSLLLRNKQSHDFDTKIKAPKNHWKI